MILLFFFQAYLSSPLGEEDKMARVSSDSTASPEECITLVQQGYDQVAVKYTQWAQDRQVNERDRLMKILLSKLKSSASVLELGCGGGIPTTRDLVSHGLDVTAVDISQAQVDIAKVNVPRAKVIQADMLKLEFNKGSSGDFDAIVAMYAIFHIPRALQEGFLIKVISWLKPGGFLLFNLNPEKGDYHMDDWMGAPMFSSSLGVDEYRRILSHHQSDSIEIIEDNVVTEAVGKHQVPFHWILAKKR